MSEAPPPKPGPIRRIGRRLAGALGVLCAFLLTGVLTSPKFFKAAGKAAWRILKRSGRWIEEGLWQKAIADGIRWLLTPHGLPWLILGLCALLLGIRLTFRSLRRKRGGVAASPGAGGDAVA